MTIDLVSLRMLVVSPAEADRALLRQGAALASVPIEIFEAVNAGEASALQRSDLDLVLLDARLPALDQARITKMTRESGRSALVILLVGPQVPADADPSRADTMAARPADIEAAKKFVERCVRTRLGAHVLLVDDSPTMRSIVRKILSATRFPLEITEASEGNGAVKQVQRGGVDIVFLDYNMPGLDGLATLTELKRAEPDLDVVIMTSTQDAMVAERAHWAGATAFLKKPFYPADIEAVLQQVYGFIPFKAAARS